MMKNPLKTYFGLLLVLPAFFWGCDGSNDSFSPDFAGSGSGKGGSTARFTVSGNRLYTVDHRQLNVFNIENAETPVKTADMQVGWGIETIFPRGQHLFIGSQAGVFIYTTEQPDAPRQLSVFQHVVSCDPVVADERYAYVTLRSVENFCGRFTNQLDILDIQDLTRPTLLITYPMRGPKGLGIDDGTLFVCDDGLKVFDASNVFELKQLAHFHMDAEDVITLGGHLLVTANDGLYQYRYSQGDIQLLSKITVNRIIE